MDSRYKFNRRSWRRRFAVICTSRCNFNCPHCIRQIFDNKKSIALDLPLDLFKQCLNEFKKINYRHVAFTGGEPILHPEFEKMVSMAVEAGCSFNVVSNAWLFKDYFPILEKYRSGLTSVDFSLDGSTAEVHDKARNKPGSYQRVIEAIKFYKARGFRVTVVTCFSQINLPQFKNIYILLESLGVDAWAIMGVTDIVKKENPSYSLSDRDGQFLLSEFATLERSQQRKSPYVRICTSSRFYNFPITLFCKNLSFLEPTVNPDGSMIFCCDIYQDCLERPTIQAEGFWPVFKLNMAVAEELKIHRANDIAEGNFFDGFNSCDYCNVYIEEILKKLRQK